jgi:hypothetical protein
MAERTERVVEVYVAEANGCYVVKAPYVPAAADAWRHVPGRRWDGIERTNVVPVTPDNRCRVWRLLLLYYPGAVIESKLGRNRIPMT